MNTTLTALIVFGCLVGAVLAGRIIRRLLPDQHLSSDSRDGIKLALGLVSTMSALVLGLLVSSAKSSYDTERSEVIQMAAKVAFLDRTLFRVAALSFQEELHRLTATQAANRSDITCHSANLSMESFKSESQDFRILNP